MNKFFWLHVPTSGTNVYVDHRGNDETGDGSAQNPYQTILKATTVATAGSNIVLGDGVWTGSRYSASSKYFNWFGNAFTVLRGIQITKSNSETHNYEVLDSCVLLRTATNYVCAKLFNCFAFNLTQTSSGYGTGVSATNSILINSNFGLSTAGSVDSMLTNCITYNVTFTIQRNGRVSFSAKNSIDLGGSSGNWNANFTKNYGTLCKYCNLTIGTTYGSHSINNSITGQTISDYFNYVHPSVLNNPANATLNEWLTCDFTAKAGSANIGAGENSVNIGLKEGFVCHATNDSNDIFNPSNGAILKNVGWNQSLNGYMLEHVDKVCVGATSNTITLAVDAEPTDDYYNDLFIGITNGSGYGEIHRIVDYDGATKVATIDGNWTTLPDTNSVYSISGIIESATKDFGKIIQVGRNWAFCYNMASWSDSNDPSYEMWKEFITTPLYNETTQQWELRPCGSFRYEYSLGGSYWHNSAELIAGTNSDNKTYASTYGNASELYVANQAKMTRLRYARFHIEIGFNIGKDA